MSQNKLFNFILSKGGEFNLLHRVETTYNNIDRIRVVRFTEQPDFSEQELDSIKWKYHVVQCKKALEITNHYVYVWDGTKVIGLMTFFNIIGEEVKLDKSTDWNLLIRKIGSVKHHHIIPVE